MGGTLRRIREERRWSRWDLAKRSDVHPMTIYAVETNRQRFGIQTAMRLARALEVPVDDLLEHY